MKRNPYFWVLVGIAVFMIGYIALQGCECADIAFGTRPVPTTTTTHLSTSTPYATAEVDYPSFPAVPGLDARVKSEIDKRIADHFKNAEESWKARLETAAFSDHITATPKPDERFSLIVSWSGAQSGSDATSFTLDVGGYSGGAHGYEEIIAYNVDSKSGKDIALAEVYPKEKDAVAYVAPLAIKELKANIAEQMQSPLDENLASEIEAGAGPKPENYKTFTFTATSTTIYFQQYQVGPYVLGIETVTLPR